MSRDGLLLISGPANERLAHAVASELGRACAPCEFMRFPDGEVSVRIDASVRGREVLLIQPTSPPVNDHLMELLAFADACRRGAAASVAVVTPYFGYARSDRRQGLRVPVTASLVAELMEVAGVHHVITIDVHSAQTEGFFRIPVDNLTAVPVLCSALAEEGVADAVIVAPDLGAAKLATEYGRRLELPVAVVHKLRKSASEVTSAGISGEVQGRRCVVVDDMITTGGTIEGAIAAVRGAGAEGDVLVAATHGVLTDAAWERLARAGVRRLLLTDTVALGPATSPSTRIVSVAPIIAAAVTRIGGERARELAVPVPD